MEIRTHTQIDTALCGTPEEVSEKYARVKMCATEKMAVDETGLVHGGFVFGLADHAAMIAVNYPTVVLGSADVSFLKPARTGDVLVAVAGVASVAGKKYIVEAAVFKKDEKIFTGRFDCFVPEKHVMAAQ